LLSELRNGKGAVLLRTTGGKGSKANHEKVETGEGDQVDSKLSQIRVELTRETERASDSAHDSGYKVVKITKGGGGELEGTEADVVKSLVVDAEHFISVLNKLVNRESGIVWLNHGVRHLGGGNNGEGAHDAIRVFLTDL